MPHMLWSHVVELGEMIVNEYVEIHRITTLLTYYDRIIEMHEKTLEDEGLSAFTERGSSIYSSIRAQQKKKLKILDTLDDLWHENKPSIDLGYYKNFLYTEEK